MPVESNARVQNNYVSKAAERGVEFEIRPVDLVVVTGFAAMTPLGNAEETWQKLDEGVSGVKSHESIHNPNVKIGAFLPRDSDPIKSFPGKARGLSTFSATTISLARQALDEAGLLTTEGVINSKLVHPYEVSGWNSSGYAATDQMIEIHDLVNKVKEGRVTPDLSLQIFPEQGNGRAAQAIGYQGSGGNTMEACATGASNFYEGWWRIKTGLAKVAIVGAMEDVTRRHPSDAIAAFDAIRALSRRNEEPERASRPFDKDRDGFVVGEGGAYFVLEALDHALERGAPIHAVVLGGAKSMDAYKTTELNSQRVADTIAAALYDKVSKSLRKPDAIFAHATSTEAGDPKEVEALQMVLQNELGDVPITAIKSMIGHLMGGAGAVNIMTAIQAIRDQKIPRILNLDNPDPEIAEKGALFVRNTSYNATEEKPIETVLATAYGFGGYNSVLVLGRYRPQSMAKL